ncbi:hypothetical protein [Nocardioides sp. InS609-2]|uniref:hypothetical protein n=1 Tax=Nocardioides sp. InS609-2 TaxID=2760705 RepID=UPI0020C00AD8|nr:hypothetical protein [Nocardioides sp. InS609-2]
MDFGLPTPRALVTTLTDLLDRDVTLTPAPPFIPGPFRPATLGVYVDDSLQVVAVGVLDIALSAYASASLVMLPRKAAWEAVSSHTLTTPLRDQLHVVLTTLGELLTIPGERIHLYAVHAAGDRPPEFVLHKTWVLERRLDVRITVPGYGSGLLALVRA